MATSAGMQCTPTFSSNLTRVKAVMRPSQAYLARVKPHGYESFGLGLRQSLGYLRDRQSVGGRVVIRRSGRRVGRTERRTGCVCMAGEKKDTAQPTAMPQGKEDGDDRRVDPVGFLKEKGLKTKAFQTFTRERFFYLSLLLALTTMIL